MKISQLILSLLILCFSFDANGQATAPVEAKIEALAWLAGHWQGEAFGGHCEEVWTSPKGPSMMGMYKLIREGKVVFHEFMTISETEHSLQLQMRHFNADLSAWEAKEEQLIFPLEHLENQKATFGKLTFERINDQQLRITLRDKDKSGQINTMVFTYALKPD